MMRVRLLRKLLGKHLCLDRQVVLVDRTLPVQLCPLIRLNLPKSKIDYPSVDFEGCSKVIKYGWLILLGKFVLSIADSLELLPDKNASFSNSSVSNYNEFNWYRFTIHLTNNAIYW